MSPINHFSKKQLKSINNLLSQENSIYQQKYFSFKNKYVMKGTTPILFIIKDRQASTRITKRKINYGRTLRAVLNSHIIMFDEKTTDVAFQKNMIHDYIFKNNIKLSVVLSLPTNKDEFLFYSDNHILADYLKKTLPHVPFPAKLSTESIHKLSFEANIEIALGKKPERIFFDFISSFTKILECIHLDVTSRTQCLAVDKSKGTRNIPLNRIEINEKNDFTENDHVIIFNPKAAAYAIGCIKINKTLEDTKTRLSTGLKKKLQMQGDDHVIIHPLRNFKTEHLAIQNIEHIASGHITVSEDIYQFIENLQCDKIEIANPITVNSLDIFKEKIICQPGLKAGTIKMNFLQRQFLDFEQPLDVLPKYYFEKYINDPSLSSEDKEFLNKHYENEKVHNLEKFEDIMKMKGILRKVDYYHPQIYPILDYKKEKRNFMQKLKQNILHFMIRDKFVALKVVRPYSTDETNNTIRISGSVMKTLGVEESDIVELHYRGKTITAQVLEFNSMELVKETNIVTSEGAINISVGIPAHLRSQLGITQIGKVCVVSRDLNFLLRKSLNIQFLPIIAIIFTIFSLTTLNVYIKIATILLLLPVASYVSLSPIREKIPKQEKRTK